MPDAGLTDEEVEQMLAAARQEDAEDHARWAERRQREREEWEALDDEVDGMLEGVRGVVDQDILRNRRLIEEQRLRRLEAEQQERERIHREQQENWRRHFEQGWRRQQQQSNLVDVNGQVMQVIKGGQLWEHVQEPNVQLRVTQATDDEVIVAPVGISAQVGLPGLFRLTVEVFARNFRFRPEQIREGEGDLDLAAALLNQLSREGREPGDDGIDRRTVWERLMDDDEDDESL